jgi:hypothetical protein
MQIGKYIVSTAVEKSTLERFEAFCAVTGFNRSQVLRMLVRALLDPDGEDGLRLFQSWRQTVIDRLDGGPKVGPNLSPKS